MFVLVLGLSLSLASVLPSVDCSCSHEPCRPYSESPSDRGDLSEERILRKLLCHLDCLGMEEDNEFALCQENCSANIQIPSLMPTLPAPTAEPILMRISDDGLYSVTLPNVTDSGNEASGSGSDVMTGNEQDHEVYLVRVRQNNDDTFFPVTSSFGSINLAKFACSEVNISYAVVMFGGSFSHYSPSKTICVFLPQGDAEAAQNLVISFEEDVLLPQQAFVYLLWDSPSDTVGLEGYRLTVNRTLPLTPDQEHEDCALQPSMTFNIDQGQTNFSIIPTEGMRFSSPLYTCTYLITLVSLPGKNNVSQTVEIVYNSSLERRSLSDSFHCNETYIPESISYDLSISWTITEQLVLETIRSYMMRLIAINSGLSTTRLSNITTFTPQKGQTEFVFVFRVPVVSNRLQFSLRVSPLAARVGPREPFYWRRPIVPQAVTCYLETVALPPNQVLSETITFDMEQFSSGILSFTVSWEPPQFPHGALDRYELCIGEDTLNDSDNCAAPSDCLYVQLSSLSVVGCTPVDYVVSNSAIVGDIDYHVVTGTELLFMQIRAVNNFALFGNWSDPVLLLNATSGTINTINGTMNTINGTMKPTNGTIAPPASNDRGLWIYVAVGVLSVLLVVLLVVVCVCVYWHFCFHRRIKYENNVTMDRLTGDYIPPSFRPVTDEWELRWEDIEIFYGEELGTGAFGRVYRGLLHCRQLRDMVNGGARTSRRGSFGRRRSSRKRSSIKSVGSHVVAIKRLKDNISGPDKANFLREIEMMKTVSGSEHDHQKFVVNMLGCVITREPMMLVLEYATHGDLLTYLRDSRVGDGSSGTNSKAAPYLEPKGAYSLLTPRNPLGEAQLEEAEEKEDKKLTGKDLLSFARQIAAGMGFLSSLNIVHRDLACRNILVCDNHLVKISDFGLSRSLVNEEAYVTTTKGVLPIRWMAPEALFYRTFDTQSDVWSFGVLLWEIYTLGGYPYPTKSNRDILELLTVGYRMEKPEICADEVYHVMLQCWNTLGVQRPTFEELYSTFDNLLASTTRHQSPYVQVLGAAYYDQLGPSHQQSDGELLDLESVPENVDTRQQHNATPHPRLHQSQSLQEPANGFLNPSGQEADLSASSHTQEANRGRSPANLRGPRGQDSRLVVPLQFSRPQSWVGAPSAELGPRYVPTPLDLTSARSSISNLTEETAFGSTIVTVTSEQRLAALPAAQSRSAGNIPLLTSSSSIIANTHKNF